MLRTSYRAGEEELSLEKARAQERNRCAWDVVSGARSKRELHAPGRGKAYDANLQDGTVPAARARFHSAGGHPAQKFHLGTLIHPKYCSDYSGNFRRVVFEQVPRRGFKDSTSLFFPDMHILGTVC